MLTLGGQSKLFSPSEPHGPRPLAGVGEALSLLRRRLRREAVTHSPDATSCVTLGGDFLSGPQLCPPVKSDANRTYRCPALCLQP